MRTPVSALSAIRGGTLLLTLSALGLAMVELLAHWSLSSWRYAEAWRRLSHREILERWEELLSPVPRHVFGQTPAEAMIVLVPLAGLGCVLASRSRAPAWSLRRLAYLIAVMTIGLAALEMQLLVDVLWLDLAWPLPGSFLERLTDVVATLRFGGLVVTAVALAAFAAGRLRRSNGRPPDRFLDRLALCIVLVFGLAWSVWTGCGTMHLYAYSVTPSEWMLESMMHVRILWIGLPVVILAIALAYLGGLDRLARRCAVRIVPLRGFSRRGPFGELTLLSMWIPVPVGLFFLFGLHEGFVTSRLDSSFLHPFRPPVVWLGYGALAVIVIAGAITVAVGTFSRRLRPRYAESGPLLSIVIGATAPAALLLSLGTQVRALLQAVESSARLCGWAVLYDFPAIPHSLAGLQAALLIALFSLPVASWLARITQPAC